MSPRSSATGRMLVLAAGALALVVTTANAAPSPRTSRPGKAAKSTAPAAPAPTSAPDSSVTMHGGQEGTVFKSLTVEGEDRIHINFDRPTLDLELDPHQAPGLDWGSARDILDRTAPDLTTPFLAQTRHQGTPFLARPWLGRFAAGSVAAFRPQVREVKRWRLVIADSRGGTVATFAGEGTPPAQIVWDGRSRSGEPVVPGLTYSYVFEAYDRAGNKRNFVGEAFTVSAFRVDSSDGPMLAFSGRDLVDREDTAPELKTTRATGPSPLILEAASWLNQSPRWSQPLRVTATARTYEQANALASQVARDLTPLLLGDPARVQAAALTEPGAPAEGTVRIAYAK